MASSTFSNVDEYGFRRPDNFDYARYEEFMSSYLVVLANRSKKWFELLKDEKRLKRGRKLRRYVEKGIPSAYRTRVWMKISGVDEMKTSFGSELFQRRLNTVLDSEIVQAIRTDLPRTFPDNIYFVPLEGSQEQLYRVLFAFAADKTEIGYCQGLNYIGGLLLLVTKDEESTFWLLKVLVDNILPDYYSRNMRGLMIDIEVLAHLVKSRMPDLHRHIKSLNIPWSLLVMKWFVCLYAEVLPTETVLRIWDCLFYHGSKVLFRVAITLIGYHRKSLIACQDFTAFMNFFKEMSLDSFALDCHTFMQKVNIENRFITDKEVKRLRKHVKVKKT